MRAYTTLFLTSGLPGIQVELTMEDQFLRDYLHRVAPRPRDNNNDLRRVVGAPTLVVRLATTKGEPRGRLTWRYGRVRWEDLVGEDPTHLLLDWYVGAIQPLVALQLPHGWLDLIGAPPPLTSATIQAVPKTGTQPRCTLAPPEWLDGPWLDDILGNNCYNYAANVAAGSMVALPGKGTPFLIGSTPTVQDLKRGCQADGLSLLTTLPATCPAATGHVIALILRASVFGGFHCFRLNEDQTWSHKDGPDAATNLDDDDGVIQRLDTARFCYPFTFVGFFHCPPNHSVD